MDTPTPELLALIAADPDADAPWQALIHRHGSDMLRLAHAILGDGNRAEDVVQDSLVLIGRSAGDFRLRAADPERSARAWIMRITANRARNCQRQDRRRQRREDVHRRRSMATHQPPDEVVRDETRDHVRSALAALPDRDRQPLELRFFAGCDDLALADALGISVNAARVRVHRASKRLRKKLQGMGIACSLSAVGSHLQAAVPPASAVESALGQLAAHWHPSLLSSHPVAAAATATAGGVSTMTIFTTAAGAGVLAVSAALFLPAEPGSEAPPTVHPSPGIVQPVIASDEAPPAGEGIDVTVSQDDDDDAKDWEAVLAQTVSVEFRDARIDEVVEFLQNTVQDANVVLDPETLRLNPTVTLQAYDMSLKGVLDRICAITGLQWSIQGEAVYLTVAEEDSDQQAADQAE